VAGLNLWFEYAPLAKAVISELWVRFIPHLAVMSAGRTVGIPGKGAEFKLGSSTIRAVPAHYLHSPWQLRLLRREERNTLQLGHWSGGFLKGRVVPIR